MPNFGVFDPIYMVNPSSGYFFRFPVYIQFYGYLLTLSGLAAALLLKGGRQGVIVLILFLAYMSLRVAIFYASNSRYRGVLLPVFIIFFSYGINILCRTVRDAYKKGALEYAG